VFLSAISAGGHFQVWDGRSRCVPTIRQFFPAISDARCTSSMASSKLQLSMNTFCQTWQHCQSIETILYILFYSIHLKYFIYLFIILFFYLLIYLLTCLVTYLLSLIYVFIMYLLVWFLLNFDFFFVYYYFYSYIYYYCYHSKYLLLIC